ncbi:hypothetical protein Pmani_010466 [Petrolisthes manimaculis]|uniref:Reverse transcriptase domain-containing protein n=1 Tax=Petrolisthes manimaculis TaxID=1843537 RepID=A0AAE1UCN3_9EUCA|nr:hypothetical protein Pmani_010466 [Petrolisthes manimaculis]
MDNKVTSGYARIKGYSSWVRKDRSTLGGGVALCFKNSLRVVVLDTPIPADLEVIIWKVCGDKDVGILCVGCYRPPSQGTVLIDYLLTNLDRLMTDHHCKFVIILGDLNQRGIQHSFDSLLAVFNLQNYVTFPTHRSGSSIDPVVTDLPSHEIQCSSMGPVGSSDHEAILTKITFKRPRDESITPTLWQWESADWCKLRNSLEQTDWESVLQGDVDQQVEWSTSNDKYRAWRRYKRHPTRHNRTLLRAATARLVTTQAWAREQWEECLRRKLRGGNVGSKQWWGLVKDAQGETHESSIPPLIQADGTTVHLTKDKVDLLAQHFARKMTVPDPTRATPSLPVVAGGKLTSFSLSEAEVRASLSAQWALTGKVLEGIITQRLTTHLEEQYLLSERQFGFRKGRSAADLNLLLVNEWSDALDQGRPTAVLALDIAGAFDRVWHPALVERLHAAGLSGGALELLRHYLLERHLKVVHNGQQSPPCNIEAGVPQGSVLGPLLWNIYVNDLLNLVPSAKAYADDVTVSVSFAPGDETSTISHLNTILHRLEIWGRRWQVSFAPHKTHLMVVSRTRHDIRLFFDGAFLAPSKELKILGVTYDDKLNFKPHIMQLARTAAGQLASLRRISWLLDNRGRELLYKAQIRSTLEYSCLAWGGAAPSHIAVLDKVQRRAERIIWDGQQRQPGALQCLQHRRDVAGLTTFFKAQVRRTPHLNQLRQAERRTEVFTRTVAAEPGALALHRSHSTHHQRQFTQVYTRLWNCLLASDSCPNHLTNTTVVLQRFKVLVHRWLSSVRDSDTEH